MRLLPLCFTLILFTGKAQSVAGKWTTIDENSGEQKSVVEIYQKDNRYFGKVIKIYVKPGENPDPVCDQCPHDDSRHDKKIIGMEILSNMKQEDTEFTDGSILDPEVGKIYRCKLWLEGTDLKVRGYWGPFYRTQTWKRVQ